MHGFFINIIPLASIFFLRILFPLTLTFGFAALLKRIDAKWMEQ
jgi:hypothetical protein